MHCGKSIYSSFINTVLKVCTVHWLLRAWQDKKLRNTTGRNTRWSVYKAYAYFLVLILEICYLTNCSLWSCLTCDGSGWWWGSPPFRLCGNHCTCWPWVILRWRCFILWCSIHRLFIHYAEYKNRGIIYPYSEPCLIPSGIRMGKGKPSQIPYGPRTSFANRLPMVTANDLQSIWPVVAWIGSVLYLAGHIIQMGQVQSRRLPRLG